MPLKACVENHAGSPETPVEKALHSNHEAPKIKNLSDK